VAADCMGGAVRCNIHTLHYR